MCPDMDCYSGPDNYCEYSDGCYYHSMGANDGGDWCVRPPRLRWLSLASALVLSLSLSLA